MKLMEFFGKSVDVTKKKGGEQDDQEMRNELFWFILDHDLLHKEFFHPIAIKIKKAKSDGHIDKDEICNAFMPMVKRGCLEFYRHKNLKGKISKLFNKQVREDLCEKLFDHYREDILAGKYKLGA